jgi:hypothetical protein
MVIVANIELCNGIEALLGPTHNRYSDKTPRPGIIHAIDHVLLPPCGSTPLPCNKGLTDGQIVAIVLASILGAIVVGALIGYLVNRLRKRTQYATL